MRYDSTRLKIYVPPRFTLLRFTRVVFGLTTSPFLLNGVIARHLELIEPHYPDRECS